MAENPYKTPVDDRILEGTPVRLTRVWKRFLSLIEALGSRTTAIETTLGTDGFIGPAPARILTRGENSSPALIPANTWTPLPLGAAIPNGMAVNMELQGDRIVYTGTAANNIQFISSMYVFSDAASPVEIGFRKNGDDGTVLDLKLSEDRIEFAAGLPVAYDMVQNDYVEVVIRMTISRTLSARNLIVYGKHSGFDPNGA